MVRPRLDHVGLLVPSVVLFDVPVGRLEDLIVWVDSKSSTVEEVSIGQGDHAVEGEGDILRQVCYGVLFMRKETTALSM